MNFLAHLHLADPDPGLMIGGIAADFIKASELALLPPRIQDGVRLHRRIDSYTDSHPVVRASVVRIAAEYHWYSGIIIDIYYDHILASEWAHYSTEPLVSFTRRAYDALEPLIPRVPDEPAGFLRWMIDDDRLLRYSTVEGIEDTLARVSRRIAKRIPRNPVHLELAMPLLRKTHDDLTADFHRFYPDLRHVAELWRGQPPSV